MQLIYRGIPYQQSLPRFSESLTPATQTATAKYRGVPYPCKHHSSTPQSAVKLRYRGLAY